MGDKAALNGAGAPDKVDPEALDRLQTVLADSLWLFIFYLA